jgi:hypothetical protein
MIGVSNMLNMRKIASLITALAIPNAFFILPLFCPAPRKRLAPTVLASAITVAASILQVSYFCHEI